MNRLLPIEGLRAYLAFWVVITHVIFFSSAAFEDQTGGGIGVSVIHLLRSGTLAVEVFMIISGFVIFLLLDKKRESYEKFIIRRFFRLYPLYIVLLLVAIATNPLEWSTFEHSRQYMASENVAYYTNIENKTWEHWGRDIFIHLGMLQGIPAGSWLGTSSAYAFMISAWSISVEWEFYLVAPLIYLAGVKASPLYRLLFYGAVFAVYLSFRHWYFYYPALPLFIPFFFAGIASYFIYKILPAPPPDTAFPIALGLAASLFVVSYKQPDLIPFIIWIPFLGLLCEDPDSISARLFLRFFNNGVAQFLGAISYGIYLSHELIIFIMQYLLVTLVPSQGKMAHFVSLLFLTLVGTVALAAVLHQWIELPGMDLGKKLASRIKSRPLGESIPAS